MTPQQLSTFVVGRQLYGVGVEHVQEVIRYQRMTRVPLAPRAVAGLINLRGDVIPALDLRQRLGLPMRQDTEQPFNVVVRTDHGPVSLLVDQVGAVVDVCEEDFAPVPSTVPTPLRDLLRGAYTLQGQLLLSLDVPHVVQLDCTLPA